MTVLSPEVAVLAGAVLAVLIGGAVWALLTGLRARAAAREAVLANRRYAALLGSAPALSMVVRADGRLELSPRLQDWLGLGRVPRELRELAGEDDGLTAEDAAGLFHDIAVTQKSSRPFTRAIRANGSTRSLMVHGARVADSVIAPGGVVLWFFDATDSEAEIARLVERGDRLRDAFDALTGLIEAAPMPMWYRDRDLRLLMVNSAYVEAVEGKDADDVVARGLELVEGAGMGGPLATAAQARDSGHPSVETMPATVGGARRMLRIHDVPMPIGGIAGFAIDIEEVEQARAGAKRFGNAQRAMLDRLSAGVAQFNADRTLAFWNGPFARMFAMRPEWLTDRPEFDRVLERMREAKRVPEVRDFPGWKAERREWFVDAGGGHEESWHLAGGTHLRVVAQSLPDGGLLLIFEDRTEQVQLASARDTLLRVRTATFDNLFEALGVFAADGRLQLWNSRFRAVWDLEEEYLASHPRVDTLAEQVAARLRRPSRSVVIAELVRSATVDRKQRGGEIEFADGRQFEFAAVPLPDGNALFTMLDITDRRRVERALRDRNEALEAADRVKTAFVASMSYELRTPLTSIGGFGEMLAGGYAGELPEQARDYVGAILESVERLGSLIDDVLDLTESEGRAPSLDVAEVEFAPLIEAAIAGVAPLANARGITLEVEADGAGRLAGDAKRLRQTVEHLLRHAVAVTPEGGVVRLGTAGTAELAQFAVADGGAGMSEAEAAHAFDRFTQTGAVRDGSRALGLDLPLAKQFVVAHGGTIRLTSAPGEGTTITVELPRAAPPKAGR